MPPKKKKTFFQQQGKGQARLFLESNFSLPDDITESTLCQNGHVLLQYFENDKVIAHTAKRISEIFTLQSDVQRIHRLVKKASALMKNIHQAPTRKKFEDLCNEYFVAKPLASSLTTVQSVLECTPILISTEDVASEISQSDMMQTDSQTFSAVATGSEPFPCTSITDPVPSTSSCSPHTVSVMLRSDDTTPRKQLLKRRLSFVSKAKSEMQEKHRRILTELKAKIKTKPNTIKHLNQTIKRKETTIRNLKQNLREASKQKGTQSQLNMLNKEKFLLKRKNRAKLNQIREKIRAEFESKLRKKEALIRKKDKQISYLETIVDKLQEKTEDRQTGVGKKDKKTYSTDMRMMAYDCIVNQTPARNIPTLLQKIFSRLGSKVQVPSATLVKQMTRELGVISDLHAAKIALTTPNLTLGFDATTQEGMHINSVHLTTKPVTTDANVNLFAGDQQPGEIAQDVASTSSDTTCAAITNQKNCFVIAVDELEGGTSADYEGHIMHAFDHLAAVHSDFHKTDYQETRSSMINNISNTMSDRAAVNSATVQKLCEAWDKSLNKLNCHLHPLETITTSCKKAVKFLEKERGTLLGNECIAANIVVAVNKLRFRDGKGDPRGFENFLDENKLPRGLIPRYKGNRLHVFFLTCGLLVKHHDLLMKFFSTTPVTIGALTECIKSDFKNETAKRELCVLGLLGKKLSGPWMKTFYVSAESKLSHMQALHEVKKVITCLEEARETPLSVITAKTDFFGNLINVDDGVYDALVTFCPFDDQLKEMITACISEVLIVINRQFADYMKMDITEELERETASARLHNMDAEAVMGMISAEMHRSPNATVCFMSSKVRAIKNGTVGHLDSLEPEEREKIVEWAVKKARNQRDSNKAKYEEMKKEISKRLSYKRQQKDTRNRKRVESQLKTLSAKNVPLAEVLNVFPDLNSKARSDLCDIFEEKHERTIERTISHFWFDSDGNIKDLYCGKIKKKKIVNKQTVYVVDYWKQDQAFDEAIAFDMKKFELAADIVLGDLVMSY